MIQKSEHNYRDDIDGWINRDYPYLVLPRLFINAMPDEWRARLANLLYELTDEFPYMPSPLYGVSVGKLGNQKGRTNEFAWMQDYKVVNRNLVNKFKD